MSSLQTEDVAEAFRHTPVRMGIYVVGPLLLALAQLGNSLATGFPLWAAAAFALVMTAYAVLFTQYHVAHRRLASLETSTFGVKAD